MAAVTQPWPLVSPTGRAAAASVIRCSTTSTSQGRLLVTMLAAIAEFERELIRQRTGEGRAPTLAAGIRFGRKPKLSDFQRKEALARRGAGETLAQIARSYAVSVSMISRL
jgi:DNA invertase Pin-like site-specific DNA recombinase